MLLLLLRTNYNFCMYQTLLYPPKQELYSFQNITGFSLSLRHWVFPWGKRLRNFSSTNHKIFKLKIYKVCFMTDKIAFHPKLHMPRQGAVRGKAKLCMYYQSQNHISVFNRASQLCWASSKLRWWPKAWTLLRWTSWLGEKFQNAIF